MRKFAGQWGRMCRTSAVSKGKTITSKRWTLEMLEPRQLLAAEPIINEFMADNDGTLLDDYGNSSDWIELFNAGNLQVDLAGWYLTDDQANLTKWQFPDLPVSELDVGEYLVVFASNNQPEAPGPAGRLHAGFQLGADGEYVALVMPDGRTVVSQFGPAGEDYPEQVVDVSYGWGQDADTTALVQTDDLVHVLVPDATTGPAYGGTWTGGTEADFQNAGGLDGWTTGTTGVGYDTAGTYLPLIGTNIEADLFNTATSAYLRIPFDVASTDEIASLALRMNYDDGFIAYLNGHEVARAFFDGTPAWNSVSTTGGHEATGLEDFDITAHVNKLTVGTNLLAVHGLNHSAESSDFLIQPEIVAGSGGGITTVGYMLAPTPGMLNGSTTAGFVADTTFSVDRGFYDEPFTVTLGTDTPEATIRYTTDGSWPSETAGLVYTEPISIDTTTTLRAVAYKSGYWPTNVDTQTYIFPEDVIRQTGEGFPAGFDYAMDPDVVDDPRYSGTIADDLKSLPTLSIVMDVDDMFGGGGIYANPRSGIEKATSVELIHPDGTEGFQVNAAVKTHGNPGTGSRLSMRLHFKEPYGPTKLEYPLFGPDAADSFDVLVLRSGYTDFWTWPVHIYPNPAIYADIYPEIVQYIRDQWSRETQLAMGHPSPHGTFVHLYVNGLYWGLCNTVERPGDNFGANYLGGEKEEYDVIHDFGAQAGDMTAWSTMLSIAAGGGQFGSITGDAAYADIQRYLDVDNFIDYMILNLYGGNWDWPHHNWYASRHRSDEGRFRFYMWDGETMLGYVTEARRLNVANANSPGQLYAHLRTNEEFRLRFADRIQKHLFGDGELTPEKAAARHQEIADRIQSALNAEAARWGDLQEDNNGGKLFNTIDHWLPAIAEKQANYFPKRTDIVVDQFRSIGLYPDLVAPVFEVNGTPQHGGQVAAGDALTMTLDKEVGWIDTPLVAIGDEARVTIPDAPTGLQWTTATFDDDAWPIVGPTGIGFDGSSGLSYDQQVLGDEPVGYWRFEDPSPAHGQTAASETNDATLESYYIDNPQHAASAVGLGNALDTEQNTGYMEVADNALLDLSTGIAIEAVVTRDGIPDSFERIVDKNYAGGYAMTLNAVGAEAYGLTPGHVLLGLNGVFAESSFDVTDGLPHHVVGTWDGQTMQVYVDGVPGTAVSFTGPIVQNENPLVVGANSVGTEHFTGQIDEVALYAAGLTEQQVQSHFASYATASFGGMVETDVSAMHGVNATAYVRTAFDVADASALESLTLRMKYDDGFVAYINGVEVVARNAPASPAFDASAITERPVDEAVRFEEITLDLAALQSGPGALMVDGNVLAIHALNSSSDDGDLLIVPELIGRRPELFSVTSELLGIGADARVLIPDAPVDPAWTSADFDDDAWPIAGPTGIGFEYNQSAPYDQEVLADSPVGYWRFEDPDTGDDQVAASEINSPALNGAYGGDAQHTAGEPGLGNALDLRQNTGYVTVADGPAVDFPTAITIEAVITRDGMPAFFERIVDKNTSSGYVMAINSADAGNYGLTPGTVLLSLNNTFAESSVDVTDGLPHHVVGTWDGQTMQVYVDGVPGVPVSFAGPIGDNADPLSIGVNQSTFPGAEHFTGQIDEVAVYGAGLSPQRVQDHFAAIAEGTLAGLFATDVSEMQGVNASAYIRTAFDVDDPGSLDSLTLRMKYDDGFIAYINGAKVAERNAPASTAYDSSATAEHPTDDVVRFEEIALDLAALQSGPGALRSEGNVLAIHALNVSAGDGDLLIVPELLGTSVQTLPIYFTTDGSDPRAPDGTPVGEVYAGSITLTEDTLVKARFWDGDQWSALGEALFVINRAAAGNLVISELHYNPLPATEDDTAALPGVGGDDFEFIELMNISDAPVSLAGVSFISGEPVTFALDPDVPAMLGAGETALLVHDPAAFALRFGDPAAERIVGLFESGRLRDEGEQITLLDAAGQTIHAFRYNDKSPWPAGADGTGMSMQLILPDADPDHDDPANWMAADPTPGALLSIAVVDQYVFYADSALGDDDASIATDKTPLLPGETASAANYTNYSGGINGVMIDVVGPTIAAAIQSGELAVAVGNSADPSMWQPAPTPTVTVREDAGRGGSDRIVLTWETGEITNAWLQVTIPAGANTGLTEENVFYFGSAVGEVTGALGTGLPTPPNGSTEGFQARALVNADDVIAVRDNPRGAANPAAIDNAFDLNRNGLVDAIDLILARNNATSPMSALRLITPVIVSAAPVPPDAESRTLPPVGEGESTCANRSKENADTPSLESIDGLMAGQLDQTVVNSLLPSPTLGKLLRRLASCA